MHPSKIEATPKLKYYFARTEENHEVLRDLKMKKNDL